MRPLVVELLEKIIEFALLLQTVQARGTSGLHFERKMHAFMSAILLRMTGLDAFESSNARRWSRAAIATLTWTRPRLVRRWPELSHPSGAGRSITGHGDESDQAGIPTPYRSPFPS